MWGKERGGCLASLETSRVCEWMERADQVIYIFNFDSGSRERVGKHEVFHGIDQARKQEDTRGPRLSLCSLSDRHIIALRLVNW